MSNTRLVPGFYHCTWTVTVGSNGIAAFNAANCSRMMRDLLTQAGCVVLASGPVTLDNSHGANPWPRIDSTRVLIGRVGFAICDVYLQLTADSDGHRLNTAAASAFKGAFGNFGSQWSVSSNAVAFDNDTYPSGSLADSLGVAFRSNAIAGHRAEFVKYEPARGTPTPTPPSILTSAADRPEPQTEPIADRLRGLLDPGSLIPSVPIEYKVVGGVLLGVLALGTVALTVREFRKTAAV